MPGGGEVGWLGGGALSRKFIEFIEMIAFIGLQIAGRRGSCEARKPGGLKMVMMGVTGLKN